MSGITGSQGKNSHEEQTCWSRPHEVGRVQRVADSEHSRGRSAARSRFCRHRASASLTLPQAIESTGSAHSPCIRSLAKATGRQEVLVRLSSVGRRRRRLGYARRDSHRTGGVHRSRSRAAPATEVVGSVQLVLNAVVPRCRRGGSARDRARTVGHAHRGHRQLRAAICRRPCRTSARRRRIRSARAVTASVVAVIDSGIDYTHRNLGGPGTQAAYEAAWAPIPAPPAGDSGARARQRVISSSTIRARQPTTDCSRAPRSIGGCDFVGEVAGRTPLSRQIPIRFRAPDATTFGGHGTHVADIIGGVGRRRAGRQALRSESLLRAATSCSGVALIQAWSTRSIRTATATPPTTSTSSTCRSVRCMDSRSTTICRRGRCRDGDRRADGRFRRQQRRQAVHHRFAGRAPRRR